MGQRIKIRRDNSANWASINPVLLDGEQGYDRTLKLYKTGDGATNWASLPFDYAKGSMIAGAICSITSAPNAAITTPHGLGAKPNLQVSYLECLVAVNGYAVGDVVDFQAMGVYPISITIDATNVKIVCNNATAGVTMIPKGGGVNVVTAIHGNFKVVVKCWAIK